MMKNRSWINNFFLLHYPLIFISFISLSISCNSFQKKKFLHINELLASNSSGLTDSKNETNDWVEIYNSSDKPIDMGGMYFTDELSNLTKWEIPLGKPEKTIIEPNAYLLFWFDKQTWQGEDHVDGKLSKKGEALMLVDKDGYTVIDSISFPVQKTDISYGKQSDGSTEWTYFNSPSPRKTNATQLALYGITKAPKYSKQEGFYKQPIQIEIAADEKDKIYFTTNGSEPNIETSHLYRGPIEINKTTVVRAIAARNGFLNSKIKTRSFFINEQTTLPIVSLVCDSLYLFSNSKGIYTLYEQDLEAPAHIEYFINNKDINSQFSANVGINIGGYVTRKYVKKSFNVKFRGKWGKKRIKYTLFDDKPHVESFNGLTLRADISSGRNVRQFIAGERLKNELVYQVNYEMGSSLDVQAYKPVSLFLNGKYWGIYNMMERKGKDFVKQNHGYDDIDMITTTDLEVNEGNRVEYLRLKQFIETRDLTVPNNYEWVKSKMEILDFIDYWIYETYTSARDIEYNIRFWRPRTDDGKWHWISYDMDYWKKWDHETLEIFLGDEDEVNFLPELLKNKEFRNLFLNRFCDYFNTTLSPSNVHRLVDEITAMIEPEIDRERARWGDQVTYCEKGSQVQWMKEYADKRPGYLLPHMAKTLGLDTTMVSITIEASEGGRIQVNTITPHKYPWQGVYYQAIPIELEAIPYEGYQFESWSVKNDTDKPKITFQPQNKQKIKAIFTRK